MPQDSRATPRIDRRWIRHDAHLWIQPNIERWMKPGVDPADVIPALAEKRAQEQAAKERARAAEDAAFDAWIDGERRLLAAMREELNEIKAELARRRLEEAKYSPSQPRVPKRNPGGGQWTRVGGGIGQAPSANIAKPMGNVDVGDMSGSSELTGLFSIAPSDPSRDGVQLAADFNQVGSDGKPVTDVDGSPYYAPGGHHEMPKGVYSKWNLSPETEKVFSQSTTGELPKGLARADADGVTRSHYWSGPRGEHGIYNQAVAELSENFMSERNINPESMTPDQARDLLKAIRESDDPRIRSYNRMIRMLRRVFRGGRE